MRVLESLSLWSMMLLVLAYILFIVSVVVGYTTPENGYTLFIVTQAKDSINFLSLSLCLASASLVLTLKLSLSSEKRSLIKLEIGSAIFLLWLIVSSMIFLWKIKSYYYVGGSDLFNYMGESRDILHLSHVPNWKYYPNFYPAQPLLVAILSLITKSTVVEVFYLLPILYRVLVVEIVALTFEYLAKSDPSMIKNKSLWMLIGSLLAIPNYFGGFIYPYNQTFSMMIFGLIFALYLRIVIVQEYKKNLLLLLPLLLMFPSTHPIPPILLMAGLSTGCVVLINDNNLKGEFKVLYKVLTVLILTSLIWWGYISIEGLLGINLKMVLHALSGNPSLTSATLTKKWAEYAITAKKEIWPLLLYFGTRIYPMLVYSGIVLLGIPTTLRGNEIKNQKSVHIIKLTFSMLLGSIVLLGIVSIRTYLHNPVRLVFDNPLIFIVIPLVGWWCYIKLRNDVKKILTFLVSILLIISSTSVLTPWIDKETKVLPYGGITWAENQGIRFYEMTSKRIYPRYTVGTQIFAFISKDLGVYTQKTEFGPEYVLEVLIKQGNQYSEKAYVFIVKRDTETYTKLYQGYRYKKQDFDMTSTRLILFYSNNELKIFYRD